MNMLSKKALYGIRALIALAQAAPDSLSTGEIAAQGDLPRKFLELILVSLKRAGMAVSQRGREGGYVLAKPAAEINLADVIRAMDGPLALIPCASRTAYRPCSDCPDVETCRIRKAMLKGRDALAEVFEATTIADLAGMGDGAGALLGAAE